MKNKIRLGISSVTNCLKVSRFKRPMSVSEVSLTSSSLDCSTALSGTDLDEMFVKNLQMLKSIEENETSSISSNQSSRLYHSSLNIFISPKESMKHTDSVRNSYCNISHTNESRTRTLTGIQNSPPRKTSGQLTKTFSSYETLYDSLLGDPMKQNKLNGLERWSSCVVEKNNHSINNFLKIDKDQFSDSDKTLKSLEDISSSISSLESDTREIPLIHPKQPIFQYSLNSIPKLRPSKNDNNSRPTSCYIDTKFGRYSSNKYPSRPDILVKINGERYDKSNLVISKPLGYYPNRLCNSFFSINDGIINNYNQSSNASPFDVNYEQLVPVDTVPHLPTFNRNRSSNNILNNQVMRK